MLERHHVHVVGEAGDGYEAIRLAETERPHLVIMDVGLPSLNGIEVTRRMAGEGMPAKVLGLAAHAVQRLVQEMLMAGARGYLTKDCDGEELTRAMHLVLEGHLYLSPAVATLVMNDYMAGIRVDSESAFVQLTQREREVLQLVAEGVTTKDIADKLGISGKTAHVHRQNVMGKLKMNSVAELTRYAIREGLVQL